MASWNPTPTLGGASWAGNPALATKNQLLSSIAGLYADLQDLSGFDFQNLNVSTLTVQKWLSSPIINTSTLYATSFLSTPFIYTSDIQGTNFLIDASGIFTQNLVSAQTANFQFTLVSSIGFKAPDIGPLVDVNVDFNLGDFVQGALIGTGALLFETAVGIGIGAGATFIGIGNGIAAMINSKDPVNNTTYINTNTFEVMGGSTQLQVSTLGYASPVYSSIMRYVSSSAPNQVPGMPMFTSTLFYPGQICIRSISDPYPLVSANPALGGSTIQQFGEWVPLEGLEPTNIVADSISTLNISTGNLFAQIGEIQTLSNYSMLTNNVGITTAANFAYNGAAVFDLGSSGDANINGFINQWNFQTNQPIVFSQLGNPGDLTPGATLTLGTGAESILQISSIQATGFIGANTGYFSSLVVNDLTVVSSFSTIYTVVACNVLSTNLITAYNVSTINLEAQYIAPFTFSSILGNPFGPFDINKVDTVVSTTYNQISSLQQNIMNYTFNAVVQDEPSFSIGDAPIGVTYSVTPQNVSQWGSTIIVFNGYTGPGAIDLGWVGTWAANPGTSPQTLPGGATFDVLYTTIPSIGYAANFFLTEESNAKYPAGVSTFYQYDDTTGGNPFTGTFTARLTLPPVVGGVRSGWWQMQTPAPAPYITSNNNTFQIYQDINDTFITATDRLHIRSGDTILEGTVTLSNIQTYNVDVNSLNANLAFISSMSTGIMNISTLLASNITVNPLTGGIDTYYYKSSISFCNAPTTVYPVNYTFLNDSPDYMPQYTLLPPFIGNNYFTSYNASSWNNSVWNNTTVAALGIPLVFCGDLQQPLGTYAGTFFINNSIVSPAYALPIYYINSVGSNLLGNISGGTWGKITTTNGTTWTLTTVSNPQGITKSSYSNILSITQDTQQTNVVGTQNLYLQTPNTTLTTGTLALNADQIRVNSHKYGFLDTAGLNSYPIGIENTVYIDGNISWSNVPGGSDYWQSDATNAVYNITNTILYDANSWIIQVIPSRFRTNDSRITSWDVQPTILSVVGGGWCWGFNRYIQVLATIGGPGSNANNWNWILAIPRNYCSYI